LLGGKEANLLNLKVEEFGSLWLAQLIDRDIDLCGIVDSFVPKAERVFDPSI
jgi:aspartyl aminopeptidase